MNVSCVSFISGPSWRPKDGKGAFTLHVPLGHPCFPQTEMHVQRLLQQWWESWGVLRGLGKKEVPKAERKGRGNGWRVQARDRTPAPPPGTQKVHFLWEAMVIRPGEFPLTPLQFKNGQALIGISQRFRPQRDLHFNALEFLEEWRAFQVCEPTTAPPHWRGLYSWRPLWADLTNFSGLPLKLKSAPRPKLGEANVLPAKGLASQCCVLWKEKRTLASFLEFFKTKIWKTNLDLRIRPYRASATWKSFLPLF